MSFASYFKHNDGIAMEFTMHNTAISSHIQLKYEK